MDAPPAETDSLASGEIEVIQRMPWSSNATFLARVVASATGAGEIDLARDRLVIYKPRAGERPLWDFPRGTLCAREAAAYAVSEAAGWRIVPPTVLRDGPFGDGMVQQFIHHDPDDHYLELREGHPDRFREFAAFDVVVNNADRKSGHCLLDADGHVWGIDHGVSFHRQHKLRTVIWDFAEEPLPPGVRDALCRLEAALKGRLRTTLADLLAGEEIEALAARVRGLLDSGRFPPPAGDYPFPWPLV